MAPVWPWRAGVTCNTTAHVTACVCNQHFVAASSAGFKREAQKELQHFQLVSNRLGKRGADSSLKTQHAGAETATWRFVMGISWDLYLSAMGSLRMQKYSDPFLPHTFCQRLLNTHTVHVQTQQHTALTKCDTARCRCSNSLSDNSQRAWFADAQRWHKHCPLTRD